MARQRVAGLTINSLPQYVVVAKCMEDEAINDYEPQRLLAMKDIYFPQCERQYASLYQLLGNRGKRVLLQASCLWAS